MRHRPPCPRAAPGRRAGCCVLRRFRCPAQWPGGADLHPRPAGDRAAGGSACGRAAPRWVRRCLWPGRRRYRRGRSRTCCAAPGSRWPPRSGRRWRPVSARTSPASACTPAPPPAPPPRSSAPAPTPAAAMWSSAAEARTSTPSPMSSPTWSSNGPMTSRQDSSMQAWACPTPVIRSSARPTPWPGAWYRDTRRGRMGRVRPRASRSAGSRATKGRVTARRGKRCTAGLPIRPGQAGASSCSGRWASSSRRAGWSTGSDSSAASAR